MSLLCDRLVALHNLRKEISELKQRKLDLKV